MSTFEILAQALPTTTQAVAPQSQEAPFPFNIPWFPFALGLLALYLIMIRPQKNKEKARNNMLANLKRGDRVQTIGGILGTVVEAREDEVVLKVDETSNTKIKFTRSAIHRVLAEEEKGAAQQQ